MRNRKSIRYITLLVVLVFSAGLLAGCKGAGEQLFPVDPDKTAAVVSPTEEAPTVTEAPTAVPTAEPTPTEEPTPEPVADGPIQIGIMTGKGYDSSYENMVTLSFVSYPTVFLMDEDAAAYPELAKTLEEFTSFSRKSAEDTKEYLADARREYLESEPDDNYYYDFSELRVARADSKIVSLVESDSYYAGGAHDMYGDGGYVYSTATGKTLELTDIVTDTEKFGDLLIAEIEKKYGDILFDPGEPLKKSIKNDYIEGGLLKWYVDYTGLVAIFNPYELASFADGILRVMIPFEGNEDIFAEEYTEIPESYCFEPLATECNYYDIGADGKIDEITILQEKNEYGDIDSVTLDVNGKTVDLPDSYALSFHPYLFRVDESDILALEMEGENDFSTIYTYRLTENGAEYCETYYLGFAYVDKSVDDSTSYYCNPCYAPEKIRLSDWRDILGTSGLAGEFALSADGKLTNNTGFMNYTYEKELKLKQDLEVCDGDGFDLAKKTTLKAGSVIYPLYVNEMDGVVAKTGDGNLVSFYVQTRVWPEKIDGVDVMDIFEGINYAG